MFHFKVQQPMYGLLRTKVTLHKSEKLNVENVLWRKIIIDALNEWNSSEIILLIQDWGTIMSFPREKLVSFFFGKLKVLNIWDCNDPKDSCHKPASMIESVIKTFCCW